MKNQLPACFTNKTTDNQFRLRFYKKALTCFIVLLSLITSFFVNAQDVLTGLTSNGGPQGMGTTFSIKSTGAGFSIVKPFANWGKAPYEDLLLGSDGNYYGMTSSGGTFNYGAIFKMTSAGAITILHQFNLPVDGGNPYGSLIKGSDGNFYGITSAGGANGGGTIFKITKAGVYTVLKSFSSNADGSRAQGHLLLATDGNYYGITQIGGTYGGGTIFKFTPAGTYTVLRHLNPATDGNYSFGSLVQGQDGNLYGLTNKGGTYNSGTIFKITTGGTYTIVRSLAEATDGRLPNGNNMIVGKDGNFYGLITYGGKNGSGTIFQLTPSGTFTVIRHLAGNTDGAYPYGSLYQHSDGYLYGMTQFGGTNNAGTIFKISTDGATFSILRMLTSSTDGAHPKGGFVKGSDGNLYGMATEGGSNLYGTVFKITTGGAFTVLSKMNGAAYGNAPYESLIQSKDNTFYGTTSGGGANDFGTVFKICGGSIINLHSFNRTTEGGRPKGSLLEANDGYLYGTTSEGGTYNSGTIFKITPGGVFTIVHQFQNAEGAYPVGGLIQASDGNLYGMTYSGGTYNGGTIFKITPAGVFTVLKHFSSSVDGANPEGNLVEGKDGDLYGLNHSRVFKITTDGTFTVLHTMVASDGFNPGGSLILYADGNFYGTTSAGGKYNSGTVFKVTPTGTFDTLKSFNAAADGGAPKGSLVRGSDDNLYGLASTGGTYNAGTIFKITPTGSYTVLRHLNLLNDGGAPFGGLIVQNPPPVANPQKVTTSEDSAKAITLTGTSSGLVLTFAITTAPKNGTLTGSGANRIYTPNANFNGKDSFYFTANVSCQQSAPAKVSITIKPVNDTPALAPIGNKTVAVNTMLTFTVSATDVDAGQTETFSLINAPSGAAINATTGLFTWTPTSTGTYTFKVRVTDNGSPVLYDEEQVTVTVSQSLAAGTQASLVKTTSSSLRASLYPNPVLDKIYLVLPPIKGKANITIINMMGTVINTMASNTAINGTIELDASQLSRGMYVLQIETGEGKQTLKFIKE